MHTRERGTAHVNIFFFLITLVLFLGALGFAYVATGDNANLKAAMDKMTEENRQMRADLELRDHYIEDISKVVGGLGEYKGREGYVYKDPEDPADREPKPIGGCAQPKEVEKTMVTFAGEASIPTTLANSVAGLLSETKKVLDGKVQQATDAQAAVTTAQSEVAAHQSAVAEANRLRTEQAAKDSAANAELRQYVTAEFNKRENEMNTVRADVTKARQEMDQLREEHGKQALEATKERNVLMARIDAQRQLTELINPPQEPDGSVISSSEVAGRAWIDLGRKDMLARGVVFQITAPKGYVKGFGKVARVEHDRAELELYDVKDKLDPIVKGDRVANELYSPKLRRNIYLLGRFSYPLTKPTVKMILEQLGNRVVEKIGPGVDLVLVGADTVTEEGDGLAPLADSAEYKEALALRIEMATLAKVRDFLALGD